MPARMPGAGRGMIMPILVLTGLFNRFANFNLQDFLITILVLCISLSFHEMAHGWMAYKLGDDTASLQGRLTLNPLAHLDPIGSLTFIIAGIGWARPVPINPARFDRKITMKKGIVLTSLAGPTANLILATASAIVLYLVLTAGLLMNGADNLMITVLIALFTRMYFANISLAVFNLLPIPPLDGFKVFGATLPDRIYYKLMGYERYIGMAFLLLVLVGGSILPTIISTIAWPFDQVIRSPLNWLFSQLWHALGLI